LVYDWSVSFRIVLLSVYNVYRSIDAVGLSGKLHGSISIVTPAVNEKECNVRLADFRGCVPGGLRSHSAAHLIDTAVT